MSHVSIFANPEVGDQIIVRGSFATVTEIRTHAPGTHPGAPIYDHMVAIEYVTVRGSRWRGLPA